MNQELNQQKRGSIENRMGKHSGNTESLIDHDVFDSLIQVGRGSDDEGFARSVVDLYNEHTPQLISDLEVACENDELQKIARISHRLKGSSLSIGAKSVAEICDLLKDEACESSNYIKRWELLGRLKLTYELTKCHFKDLLS